MIRPYMTYEEARLLVWHLLKIDDLEQELMGLCNRIEVDLISKGEEDAIHVPKKKGKNRGHATPKHVHERRTNAV